MSEKQIYVVDSQILNLAMECQRKAHYTFDKNLSPIVKPAYFEKGDLLHIMLAQYYRLRRFRERWVINAKTHADILDVCVRVGRRLSVKMQIDVETIEEIISTFVQYTTHTANDDWYNITAVEEYASRILYENDDRIILYQGKIDLILSIRNCPVLPVDHKSSSRRQPANEMSNQFKGYCWLLEVNNIIINKIGFQTSLKPGEKFQRETLSYSQELIDEWREVAIYYILRYIEDGKKDFFPPNFTSCDKYSGCIFRNGVCNRTPDVREYKLAQLFKERQHWDVGA